MVEAKRHRKRRFNVNYEARLTLLESGSVTVRLLAAIALSIVSAPTSPSAAAAPNAAATATIVDLSLGGSRAQAFGINDAGQVVGEAYTSTGQPHAFLYDNGQMIDLGTLGGNDSGATAINEAGQIVGNSNLITDGRRRAFLYDNGQMINLGALDIAHSINNAGQIVGTSDAGNGSDWHAFLYQNGQMTDLGTLGGDRSNGFDINDAGQIVGHSQPIDDVENHAFLYQNGQMIDLGTLGGNWSTAYGINNAGHIVGSSNLIVNSWSHAFLYRNGQMIDLGTLGGRGSIALDINEEGQIVGSADDTNNNGYAFVYQDGKMTDLNTLLPPNTGWVLTQATGINSKGQIVGWGDRNGDMHAFLLTLPDDGSNQNQPPVANDDTLTVVQGAGATVVDVLDNDTDPDGNTIVVSSVTQPGHGTASLNGGVVRYTPSGLFSGTDSFTYTISDGQGGTDTATVTVTVQAPSSTSGAKISGNGQISLETNSVSAAAKGGNTDAVSFNFSASNSRKGLSGKLRVRDPLNSRSIEATQLTALIVSGKSARLYGTARVNGTGAYSFVLEVTDAAKKGAGADTLSLQLSNGISLSGTLQKGNITVQQK